MLCRRRAPTLCKAHLKKSTSIVLFASTSLQFADLLAENEFAGTERIRIALVQSITPVVQQSAMYAQFPRKPKTLLHDFTVGRPLRRKFFMLYSSFSVPTL